TCQEPRERFLYIAPAPLPAKNFWWNTDLGTKNPDRASNPYCASGLCIPLEVPARHMPVSGVHTDRIDLALVEEEHAALVHLDVARLLAPPEGSGRPAPEKPKPALA